jgi:hypothetical protein
MSVLLPLGTNVRVSGDSAIDARVGTGGVPEPDELPPPHDARTSAANASDQCLPNFHFMICI